MMSSPTRGGNANAPSSAIASQLQGTKFLKTTGILDAYEHVISTMIVNGWPPDKTIFEHAAYEVLKWAADNKDQYRGLVGRNIEKKQDLILSSRDNIPELSQYKLQQEMERHKLDVTNDQHTFQRTEKIQLKSRKQYTLSTNKLDVSIFQFKDRPIFKREPSPPPAPVMRESYDKGGFGEDIRQTKPQKRELARVGETDFTVSQGEIENNNNRASLGSLGKQTAQGANSIMHTETPMLNQSIQPNDVQRKSGGAHLNQSLRNSNRKVSATADAPQMPPAINTEAQYDNDFERSLSKNGSIKQTYEEAKSELGFTQPNIREGSVMGQSQVSGGGAKSQMDLQQDNRSNANASGMSKNNPPASNPPSNLSKK